MSKIKSLLPRSASSSSVFEVGFVWGDGVEVGFVWGDGVEVGFVGLRHILGNHPGAQRKHQFDA